MALPRRRSQPPMLSIHTSQLADGPGLPVVLSHALGLDHRLWSQVADRWRGLRPVLAYDHRGHGQSAPFSALSSAQAGMADLLADAAAVVEGWRRGPVVFVGLSMGAMVAQGLALRRPDLVQAAVFAHSVARYDDAGRAAWRQRVSSVEQFGMAAVVDLVVARYLTGAVRMRDPALVQKLRQTLLCNDPLQYTRSCEAVAAVDWLDELAHITCPTLFVAGAQDVGAPAEVMRQMSQRIAGSKFLLLEQASHLGPLEQPDAFWLGVEQFVFTLSGAVAHSQ
jgi:3-oxoadipate enol-lactonase